MPAAYAQNSPAATPAKATQIPTGHFFASHEEGAVRGATLAPDGKHTAYLTPGSSGRFALIIVDNAQKQAKMIKQFGDSDITNLHWVNNKRLVYSLRDKSNAGISFNPGLWAINLDGSDEKQIISHSWNSESYDTGTSRFKVRTFDPNSYLAAVLPNHESDDIYVVTYISGQGFDRYEKLSLSRVNSKTLSKDVIPRPGKIDQWLLDQSGEVRLLAGETDGQRNFYYRASAQQEWQQIWRQAAASNTMHPLGFDADGKLYVSYAAPGARNQVYRFDTAAKKVIEPPLLALKDNDFHGELLFIKGKLAGAHFETDGRDSIWFDPAMQSLQKKIDAKLSASNNLLYPAAQGGPYVLVRASADTMPVNWLLYNQATDALELLGNHFPQIKPQHMAQKDFVRFQARDGLSIPMYITLPKDSKGKNLPLVLLVHGGPNVRGVHWEWDAESQFLAARGYAVAEPLFRGSNGFGQAHLSAGFKQWGLKMQDDLVDSVQWLVKQGIADPKRVCIAGGSYGGYAAMMGLLRDPDLFRCGVAWAGVTDMQLLFHPIWSDISDSALAYWVPLTIGDPKADAERLRATSPLTHAANLKKPLLLAYGALDQRVPILHGRKFYNAIPNPKGLVEWIEYDNEGHGWTLLKNKIDFWDRTEQFLNKHIGPQPAASAN
ncbi:alpha/beta fold hydrolase [Massilia sp. W12]|uniref:alpha/beta hydrolase family protein n=1 Tax=Massilia sp. W12 TaxID=3126507 RepID=UPI0030D2CE5A